MMNKEGVKLQRHKLNKQRTMELIAKAQNGCEDSLDTILRDNIRLVWKEAAKFNCPRGLTTEDLVQYGLHGIIKAVKHYDVTVETNPATYFIPAIRTKIIEYLRTYKNAEGLTSSAIYNCNLVKEHNLENEPAEVILEKLGDKLKVKTIAGLKHQLEHLYNNNLSGSIGLDSPMSDNALDDLTVKDAVEGDVNGDWLSKHELAEAMETLDSRSKTIIKMYFLEDYTLTEISNVLDISQPQVSRIKDAALYDLKKCLSGVVNKTSEVIKPLNSTATGRRNAKGDRQKVIELLQEGVASTPSISAITGVPQSTVRYVRAKLLKEAKQAQKA